MQPKKLHHTVKIITNSLVKKQYCELAKMCNEVRLNGKDIEKCINDYGSSIVKLPRNQFNRIDVIYIKNSIPKKWSVNVPIFTKEEGISDLTLELTLKDSNTEIYAFEIDSLHVQ